MAERQNILKSYGQEVSLAVEKMDKLLEREPWIRAEEPFFGKAGSIYDFANLEPLQL